MIEVISEIDTLINWRFYENLKSTYRRYYRNISDCNIVYGLRSIGIEKGRRILSVRLYSSNEHNFN